MTPIIVAEGLQKTFGQMEAVKRVDLTVNAGVFFGFIGPNGAGKTTTIRLLTGLLTPSGGRLRVFGQSYDEEGVSIRARIGVVQNDPMLYDYLTGDEQMLFTGRMYRMERSLIRERADELCTRFELNHCRMRLTSTYSHGERKKLALACALLHDPALLFLDEPFEGIDVVALHKIEENLLRMVQRGATIFLTSHVLSWVDRFCEDIAIINHGELVFTGTMTGLKHTMQDIPQERTTSALERAFLELVQDRSSDTRLSWLT